MLGLHVLSGGVVQAINHEPSQLTRFENDSHNYVGDICILDPNMGTFRTHPRVSGLAFVFFPVLSRRTERKFALFV